MTYAAWRERLGSALDPRFYTLEYLDGLMASGRAQIAATQDCAIIVELKQFPSGAVAMHCLVAAGEMNAAIELLNTEVERAARSLGCLGLLIESREGWARALKRHGYEPFQVSIFKEL